MTVSRDRAVDLALAAAVFAFGVAICLVRGRVGYMPLDQSIVFDGGWRLMSGQVPFRDFTTPAGLTPALLQAVAFRVFGVSWLVYVAHAALVNGAFGVLSQLLLRSFGSSAWSAAAYAALGTVVFYPPFGVPYLEQHAFFFSLAALLAARLAARPWCAGLVGPLLLAAFFSKSIPTLFFVPLAALLMAPAGRRAWATAALTTAAALLALVAVAVALHVQWPLVVESLWTLPRAEGASRLSSLTVGAGLIDVLRRWSLPCLLALPLGALRARTRPAVEALVLGAGLLAASLLFGLLTNNDPENAAACAFLVVGLADAARPSARADVLRIAILLVSVVDASRFDARVNATRLVHGLADEPTLDARAELPAELSFLRWRLHFHYPYTPADLGRLVSWLRAHPGPFFLLGDTTPLYALAGQPSTSPVLWFHRRLTSPARDSPEFEAFQARLDDALRRHHVRYVVLEGHETYDGLRVGRWPVLEARVRAGRVVETIGPFRIVEVP